jgi:hypothetical protein
MNFQVYNIHSSTYIHLQALNTNQIQLELKP